MTGVQKYAGAVIRFFVLHRGITVPKEGDSGEKMRVSIVPDLMRNYEV